MDITALESISNVAIRPYINPDPKATNMGLEKYGFVVFEGTAHEEPMGYIEQNGRFRYINGLNEYAPDVMSIKDEDEKKAKIREIRKVIARIEAQEAANIIDPEDKEFWNKVQIAKPDNHDFWSKLMIRVGNNPIFLDPTKLYDYLKIISIEAGGFSMIARSFEEARNASRPPKWFLDKNNETVAVRTELKKIRNKALAELDKLANKNVDKLFYVCKVVDDNSIQYKRNTPTDIMYDNMDKYINGETALKDKRKTAQEFLNVASLDMETLKIRAMIRDATTHKIIAIRPDGFLYHVKSSELLGKTPSDVVVHLRDPLNERVLTDLSNYVEKVWMNK